MKKFYYFHKISSKNINLFYTYNAYNGRQHYHGPQFLPIGNNSHSRSPSPPQHCIWPISDRLGGQGQRIRIVLLVPLSIYLAS